MIRARVRIVAGAVMLLLAAGCASTIPKEQRALNEQTALQIEGLRQKDLQVDSLRADVRQIRSEVLAVGQRASAGLDQRQKESESLGNAIALLGDQVAALEQEVAALRTRAKATGSVSAGQTVEAKYHLAYKACQERDFAKAMTGFRGLLREAPRHELADNAQYWLGECYYATGQFDEAIAEFGKVFAFPETDKGDDAQLKIGYSYFQKGDKAQALTELNKLLAQYPQSGLAELARTKILQIEGM